MKTLFNPKKAMLSGIAFFVFLNFYAVRFYVYLHLNTNHESRY